MNDTNQWLDEGSSYYSKLIPAGKNEGWVSPLDHNSGFMASQFGGTAAIH